METRPNTMWTLQGEFNGPPVGLQTGCCPTEDAPTALATVTMKSHQVQIIRPEP